MTYTEIFNAAADRREQSLPFVGVERRAIMNDMNREELEAQKVRRFLEGVSDIASISRIAKNVNGNV